jgi:ribosomal protein L37AE/L43A
MPDIEAETPHPGPAERTMLWNYDCPVCRRPTAVDWRLRKGKVVCGSCGRTHYPPTPYEDRYAYVDDLMNKRILRIRLDYGATETCSVP